MATPQRQCYQKGWNNDLEVLAHTKAEYYSDEVAPSCAVEPALQPQALQPGLSLVGYWSPLQACKRGFSPRKPEVDETCASFS